MTLYLFKLLIIIVFILLVLNAWLFIKQPGMIFYPDTTLVASPTDWDLQYQDIDVTSADGVQCHAWYIPAKNAKKVLLFFHGNAGNISHRGDSIKIFHQLGLNVFIIDYRGYGKSLGKASESGFYQDARAAWEYLQQSLGYAPQDIIIFGRSLGGAVAANLASQVSAAGLILESTFSSVKQMSHVVLPLISRLAYSRYNFDTLSIIKQVHYPVLVIHSLDDEMIPFQLGEQLFNAANSPKYFYKMAGGHNQAFMESLAEYQQQLKSFIHRLG